LSFAWTFTWIVPPKVLPFSSDSNVTNGRLKSNLQLEKGAELARTLEKIRKKPRQSVREMNVMIAPRANRGEDESGNIMKSSLLNELAT
jgi:hypothetical protein